VRGVGDDTFAAVGRARRRAVLERAAGDLPAAAHARGEVHAHVGGRAAGGERPLERESN
jgi:hypothetical protein